jgi:hypothetical protein
MRWRKYREDHFSAESIFLPSRNERLKGAIQVRKAGNSHFSRLLAFWPLFRWNLLPFNPFQLKQTVGFPGFPEKFSGGGILGEGAETYEIDL